MRAANDVVTPRVTVVSEFRVEIDPKRGPVTRSPFDHDYWRTIFDVPLPVTLVARGESVIVGKDVGEVRAVVGPDVDVVVLPPLRPNLRLLTEVPKALRILWAVDGPAHWVLRMPGIVSSLALLVLTCRHRPFAVQVVGDPVDVAFRAGVGGRFSSVVGVVLGVATRVACRRAALAAYVTENYLQHRYPPRPGTPVHAFSNVRLDAMGSGRTSTSTRAVEPVANIRLVTVGSLEAPYKRVDLLLQAVAMLRREGWSLRLDVAGGGACVPALRDLADGLQLSSFVSFRGMLDTTAVSALLADSDLFVLCSDTEGMPRALLEAMAVGLPCLATAVGGIPEVLPPEALFRPGSVNSLVGSLRLNLVSTRVRQRNAAACRRRSEQFRPEPLAIRRKAFVDDLAHLSHNDGRVHLFSVGQTGGL